MRCDADLIRQIVLDVADNKTSLSAARWEDGNNDHKKVGYHIQLLEEQGYLKASFMSADNDPYYSVIISNLTMDGQIFADELRSQSTWDKVKERLAKAGKEVTIEILKDLVVSIAATNFGAGA